GEVAGGAVGRRRRESQRAVPVQVEGGRAGPRERPLALVAPAAAVVELPLGGPPAAATAHHEDAHGRVVERGPVAEVGVEEPELLLEVAPDAPARRLAEVDV